ncbi:hypothetical protein PHLCEN_2v13586 [Hermanssonia centrifuga]|uniref:Probable 26S proteasome regulatory subunit p27 n=1 Tax=Hermanssonia centrifuga TaxID=98765 RepID=A0A2R6NDU8_9APHY|nr:hypothetical protein PHLCEN_2v13586 [Hermanssonia centrifuga]
MGMELPSRSLATEQVRALILRKESIEEEIDAQLSILKANDSTVHTPLVDEDGFPRADIDVWAVRHARVRLIELRNDLKAIMDSIMKGLQGVYDPNLVPNTPTVTTSASNSSEFHPFAKVDAASPGSPATAAGLSRDDLILSFGTLTRSSFTSGSLQPLATFVAAQENREINIRVLRSGTDVVTLRLTPTRGWGGRGLLG